MNTVIVYDSMFGNTAKVASAIARHLEQENSVRLATVQDARNLDLGDTDLLIAGSPTRGFRPTPQMSEFLSGLRKGQGSMMEVAVFDTRLDLDTIHPAPLRWVVDAGGYAAARMDDMLQHQAFGRRGEIAGFLVTGTEGPLKDGEIERAVDWAKTLVR